METLGYCQVQRITAAVEFLQASFFLKFQLCINWYFEVPVDTRFRCVPENRALALCISLEHE